MNRQPVDRVERRAEPVSSARNTVNTSAPSQLSAAPPVLTLRCIPSFTPNINITFFYHKLDAEYFFIQQFF